MIYYSLQRPICSNIHSQTLSLHVLVSILFCEVIISIAWIYILHMHIDHARLVNMDNINSVFIYLLLEKIQSTGFLNKDTLLKIEKNTYATSALCNLTLTLLPYGQKVFQKKWRSQTENLDLACDWGKHLSSSPSWGSFWLLFEQVLFFTPLIK